MMTDENIEELRALCLPYLVRSDELGWLAGHLAAALDEVAHMRAVFVAAETCVAHQKTADIAHVMPDWLRTAIDLSKALEAAVDAAHASTKSEAIEVP